jgi:hypothetical protein
MQVNEDAEEGKAGAKDAGSRTLHAVRIKESACAASHGPKNGNPPAVQGGKNRSTDAERR